MQLWVSICHLYTCMHVHMYVCKHISSVSFFLIPFVKAISIKKINPKCVINAENIFFVVFIWLLLMLFLQSSRNIKLLGMQTYIILYYDSPFSLCLESFSSPRKVIKFSSTFLHGGVIYFAI